MIKFLFNDNETFTSNNGVNIFQNKKLRHFCFKKYYLIIHLMFIWSDTGNDDNVFLAALERVDASNFDSLKKKESQIVRKEVLKSVFKEVLTI